MDDGSGAGQLAFLVRQIAGIAKLATVMASTIFLVHIGDPSEKQIASFESQVIPMIQGLFGRAPSIPECAAKTGSRLATVLYAEILERAKGFEPSTPTLARLCSTTELHPHPRTTIIGSWIPYDPIGNSLQRAPNCQQL